MPCRNLGPHVRCSHMIEPLGARWCLGMCDVTHCNLLWCNLTSVQTSNPSQGYRVNESLVLTEKNGHKMRVALCVSQTHVCMHHILCISYMHKTEASSSMHHGVCIIVSYAPFHPSFYYTSIAIIHLKTASLSSLSSICPLSWNILSLFLDCIGINKYVLQLASSNSVR